MIKIEMSLSEEDFKNLINALERYTTDLSSEIADTDSMDFRENLKMERNSLLRSLNQLKQASKIREKT